MRARKTTGLLCSRVCCNELATRGKREYHKYCEKHYRFISMRDKARKRKIIIPSWGELEKCYDDNEEMICPYCHCQMTWRAENDVKKQLTLQHKDGGGFEFICYSCNSIHGNSTMPNKMDIFKVPDGYKWCKRCQSLQPFSNFYMCTGKSHNLNNCCIPCHKKYMKAFYIRNKNKLYFRSKRFQRLSKIVTIISKYIRVKEENNLY